MNSLYLQTYIYFWPLPCGARCAHVHSKVRVCRRVMQNRELAIGVVSVSVCQSWSPKKY